MQLIPSFILAFLTLLATPVFGQFHFFDQMFGGQGHPGHQQQREQADVGSDSAWYQSNYDAATCSKYLCPGTLSCVSVPHHCPCAFPDQEDKIELGDGSMICASRGGYKVGELARKVELARKGLL